MKIEIMEDVEFKSLRVKEGDIFLVEITHGKGDCWLTMCLNKGDEYYIWLPHDECKFVFTGFQEDLEHLAQIMEAGHLSRFAAVIREMVMPTRDPMPTPDY